MLIRLHFQAGSNKGASQSGHGGESFVNDLFRQVRIRLTIESQFTFQEWEIPDTCKKEYPSWHIKKYMYTTK